MRHVELELLVAVLEGQLPPGALLRVILGHLEALCPECAAALRSLRSASLVAEERAGVGGLACELDQPCLAVASAGEIGERFDVDEDRYLAAFASAESALHAWARRADQEHRTARRDLAALLRLPAGRRAERIRRARSRFRSRALAELLLAECRRLSRDEPEDALEVAELVPLVLSRQEMGTADARTEALTLRAAAWRANAVRVLGRLQESDRAFARVRAGLARGAVDDAGVHADICALEASLRIEQGRLGEARALLDRALLLFRQEGDTGELARVLIKRGIVERHEGDPKAAIATQQEVLSLLATVEADPFLVRSAVNNLALALCDAERFPEAAALVGGHEAFGDGRSPRWQLREHVLRGRIAHGLGRLKEAERQFAEVRDMAMERRDFFTAALAALELATLYVEQGRTRELRQVAAILGPVFEAHDLRPQATAALLLFTRAALSEGLTAEAVRRLRWKIEVGGRAGVPPPVS